MGMRTDLRALSDPSILGVAAALGIDAPGVAVAGYFGGSLANGGERLSGLDAQPEVLVAERFSQRGHGDGGASRLTRRVRMERIDTKIDPASAEFREQHLDLIIRV